MTLNTRTYTQTHTKFKKYQEGFLTQRVCHKSLSYQHEKMCKFSVLAIKCNKL